MPRRQTHLEITDECMGIRCRIIFIKLRFWTIHDLDILGTKRKRILRIKFEGCSCAKKRPVVFWTFHTSLCISRLVRGKKNTDKCMENSKRDWTLSSTRGTLGFAVLRCCSIFCAVFRWIKSHIAVLRCSQTLRCAMFVLLNLRCSVKRNYLRCCDTSSINTVYMQTMRYGRHIWLCDVFAGLSLTANSRQN